MADHSQNISNTVDVFGVGPANYWGSATSTWYIAGFTWGTTRWGEKTNPQLFDVVKVYNNTPTVAFDYYRADVTHLIDAFGSTALDSTIYKSPFHIMSFGEVVTVYADFEETLQQGSWYYVFTSDTTDGEDRDFATWTELTPSDATFTCSTVGSVDWTEV